MKNNNLKIVFYCNDTLDNINSMEYYNQDITAFKELGFEIKICNKYSDIPLNFDLIYIWWWTYALYPVLLAKLLNRKSIVTGVFNFRPVDNLKNSGFKARPIHQRILIRLALILTDINLFVSKIEYDEVPTVFKLKKFFYYPCAIGEIYFRNSQEKLRNGILNISWSGRENLKRKGVFDILAALNILKGKELRPNSILAGRPGDGYPELLNQISQFGLKDQVATLGEVSLDEKLSIFSKAKIYVQPSYFEGFGLATAEALASGCCIVACDVGEVRNVLGDGAYYVSPGNSEELAKAIETLLNNDEMRNELIKIGQERLYKLYSMNNKKESLNKFLNDLF